MRRIVYDGDSFYELDEECVRRRNREREKKQSGGGTPGTRTMKRSAGDQGAQGRMQGKTSDKGTRFDVDENGRFRTGDRRIF